MPSRLKVQIAYSPLYGRFRADSPLRKGLRHAPLSGRSSAELPLTLKSDLFHLAPSLPCTYIACAAAGETIAKNLEICRFFSWRYFCYS